jgi:hypothetical protein
LATRKARDFRGQTRLAHPPAQLNITDIIGRCRIPLVG